jgi:opacity protein-like surface antigen
MKKLITAALIAIGLMGSVYVVSHVQPKAHACASESGAGC